MIDNHEFVVQMCNHPHAVLAVLNNPEIVPDKVREAIEAAVVLPPTKRETVELLESAERNLKRAGRVEVAETVKTEIQTATAAVEAESPIGVTP